MLRLIADCIAIALFLLPFGLPALLSAWIIGFFSPALKFRFTWWCVRLIFRTLLFLSGTEVTYNGLDNLPKDDAPILFVSNHRSYFDVVIAYLMLQRPTFFVAKKEFENVPFISFWMRNMNCLFIDRENPRRGLLTILTAVEQIRDGIASIWICPEGTRGHDSRLLHFHEGSFKIAEKAGCPIIPVTFCGTDDIYENSRPFVRKAKVSVIIGKPIETAGLSRQEFRQIPGQIEEIIQATYDEAEKAEF